MSSSPANKYLIYYHLMQIVGNMKVNLSCCSTFYISVHLAVYV